MFLVVCNPWCDSNLFQIFNMKVEKFECDSRDQLKKQHAILCRINTLNATDCEVSRSRALGTSNKSFLHVLLYEKSLRQGCSELNFNMVCWCLTTCGAG